MKKIIILLFFGVLISRCTKKIQYANAINRLRSAYFLIDAEDGYEKGVKLIKQYPDSLELRAWFQVNRLSTFNHLNEEILQIGQDIAQKYPESPWGYFLIIEAYSHMPTMVLGHPGARHHFRRPALNASEKMISLAPRHPDIIWMHARCLYLTGNYEKAIEFIDKNYSNVTNPAELLVYKAKAYNKIIGKEATEKEIANLDSLYEKAMEIDSTCLTALFGHAHRFDAEDTVLVKKALAVSPYSNELRLRYWQLILDDKNIDAVEKIRIIDKDVDSFIKKRGHYPMALLFAMSIYSQYDLVVREKSKTYGDKILRKFPDSPAAEWIRTYRIRDFALELYKKPPYHAGHSREYRQMIWDYINRPSHSHKGLLFEQYRNLFVSLKEDSTATDRDLLNAAQQMDEIKDVAKSTTIVWVANTLTEETEFYDKAESIAHHGLVRYRRYAHRQFPEDISEEEFEKNLGSELVGFYDAMGWAQFKNNTPEKAEKNLLKAYSLFPNSYVNLYHLGQLYQYQKEYAKAKEYYRKGLEIQGRFINPNEKALKALCLQVDGNTEYIDAILNRR